MNTIMNSAVDSLESHRLPKYIYPLNYDLHLTPDLVNFTFDGVVRITFANEKDVNSFKLHAKSLTIHSITVDGLNAQFSLDDEEEKLHVQSPLKQGSHLIEIKYTGTLNDQMEGFYRSSYKDAEGNKHYMATTQFESTSARLAFPCWDEPNFKATFDVTIVANAKYTILSNNEVNYRTIDNDTQIVNFVRTPIMSTYLLAFIVGDLEYIEGFSEHNKRVRIYGVPGNKNKMPFALDNAIKSLDWYENWFGIDYPLSKVDLVAIPDFSAGAMENWGLITFRENSLYVDETSTRGEKIDVVYVIAHELAHQWFGNYVTMEWWTYLWLNESMATYFGWLVTSTLYPEWNIWPKFISEEYNGALNLDSLESSHPIEVPIEHTNQIQNIFDAISYSKGSCVVRFLVEYLGEEIFQKGMRYYMATYLYKNTTSSDLWKSFDYVMNQTNSNQSINNLMNCWTTQTGFPIIQIKKVGNDLQIDQRRFYKAGVNEHDTSTWIIPLKIGNVNVVIDKQTITFPDFDFTNNVINPNRTVFCRIITDTTFVANVTAYDIDDAFSAALSGYTPFTVPLDMISNIDLSNTQYTIAETIVGYINILKDLSPLNPVVISLVQKENEQMRKVLNTLGWNERSNESDDEYSFRKLAIGTLVENKDEQTLNELLNAYIKGRETNDINQWVSHKYEVAKAVGYDGRYYDELLAKYEYQGLTDAVRSGLAAAVKPELVQRNLDLIFSGLIRSQNIISFIAALMRNDNARPATREQIYKCWNKYSQVFSAGSSNMIYLVKVVGMSIDTHDELERYKTFMQTPPVGTENAVTQTVERALSRIAMINRINEQL